MNSAETEARQPQERAGWNMGTGDPGGAQAGNAPPVPDATGSPAGRADKRSVLDLRPKSPGLAAFFSGLVPGLGQVYVGYYQRGFINVMIFAALITMLASGAASGMEPLIAFPMVFFYLYNIIDASRRASLYNLALQGAQQRALELPELELPGRRGSLGGGILLIAVGLLLFLNVRFEFSLDWLRDWWPLAIMGLGVYLVVQWRQANVERERGKRL